MSDKRLIEAFTFMNVCFAVNSFYDQRPLVIAYTVSSFPALSAVDHTCPYRFGYSFRRLLGTFRQFPGKMRDSTKGTFVTSLFYCLFTVNFKKKKQTKKALLLLNVQHLCLYEKVSFSSHPRAKLVSCGTLAL